MSKNALERLSVVLSILVIVAAVIFWTVQVGDVMDTLCLSYGEWCSISD